MSFISEDLSKRSKSNGIKEIILSKFNVLNIVLGIFTNVTEITLDYRVFVHRLIF
jgi:hypothetical protein